MSVPKQRRVLITGGGGFIGSHLVRSAKKLAPDLEILAPLRRQLDLTDSSAVKSWFQREKPDVIIHCAALSRAPACDENPSLAHHLNVELVEHLVGLAPDALFVQLSTDLVFDGRRGNYTEDDVVGPLTVYAKTKVSSEAIVQKHPRHLILRISLNYGASSPAHRSFNDDVLDKWKLGKTQTFFADEFRSPIAATITTRAIWELVGNGVTGLFHLGGSERLSRWEIAGVLLRAHPQFRELARKGSLKDSSGPQRAPDTSLNTTKVQALLSFPLPKFSEWFEHNVIGKS